MRQIFLFLIFAFFSFSISLGYADGQKLWFENDGGLSRDHLTNGKIKVTQGFFGNYHVEDLVKDNPTALALTKKQSQFNTYAHLSYWIGVIPSAGLFWYGIGSQNVSITLISVGALLGTALLTGHFASESRHYMYEAINTYNGVRSQSTNDAPQASCSPFDSRPSNLAPTSVSISFAF